MIGFVVGFLSATFIHVAYPELFAKIEVTVKSVFNKVFGRSDTPT